MSSENNLLTKISFLAAALLLASCGGGGGGNSLPDEDTTPPTISKKIPDNRIIDVNIIEPITITFNEDIGTVVESNIALFQYQSENPNNFDETLTATDRVKVSISNVNNILTITPTLGSTTGFVQFKENARYKLTLLGIKDKAGNPMENTTWEFATTTIPNGIIQPTMNETVSAATDIIISFDEEMNTQSLKDAFTLVEQSATPTAVTNWSMVYVKASNTATYSIPSNLNVNSSYKVSLSTQATDLKGNGLKENISRTFSTNNKTTSTLLETKPKNVVVASTTNGIDIQWQAAPAIAGNNQGITYNVYVSTDDITYTAVVNNLSTLTYSDTTGINNNVAYRYAVTANSNGDESYKVFSGLVTPTQIVNLPAIISFLIDDNDSNTTPSENITIIEGQSIALKLTMAFKNGSGVISSSDGSTQFNTAAGSTDATVASFTTNIPTPSVTTNYTLTVTKGNTVAVKYVTVIIRKPGTFAFKKTTSSVSEDAGSIDIIVSRAGGSDGPVSVDYKTNSGGTASSTTPNNDYNKSSGTLVFTNGQTEKIISIQINDNKVLKEAPKEFSLSLSKPNNGAVLGATANLLHVVTIIDNDILSLNYGIKQLKFSWIKHPFATSYRLQKTVFGSGTDPIYIIPVVDKKLLQYTKTVDIAVHDFDWVRTSYNLDACNILSCVTTNSVVTLDQTLKAIGYFKESNTDPRDFFGASVSLSDDGLTLAVGANGESSKEPGIINFNDATAFPITTTDDDTLVGSGAVYIFTRSPAGSWKQQAYIKASNPGASDWFGFSISLSGDGLTLAVGAPAEASNVKRPATTGNGIAFPTPLLDDNTAKGGAVYVYKNTSGRWAQEAYLKKLSASLGDNFGNSVSLSRDGSTLAIGFPDSDQVTLGLATIVDIGGVNIFNRINGIWNSTPYYEIGRNSTEYHYFGQSVALSGDGNTLAVGATGEASNKTGVTNVGFPPSDKVAANFSGAVYVYDRLKPGNSWVYSAYIKANNASANDYFGISIDLSDDGGILAVGASGEGSNQLKLVNSSSAPLTDTTAANNTGAVYMFARNTKGEWVQQAYIKASNAEAYNVFGYKVTLSGNGKTLAVGASGEWSNTSGLINDVINFPTPSTDNDSAADAGAVYLFTNTAGNWAQQSYIKASNPDASDLFGSSIALSGKKLPDGTIIHDGSTLAVGAHGEDGDSAGVMNNNITPDKANLYDRSGAVYLY